MDKYISNEFTFSFDGSVGTVSAFELGTTDVFVPLAYPAASVSNALITSGDGSGLGTGVYILTLEVTPLLHLAAYPIVNFNISIVEGNCTTHSFIPYITHLIFSLLSAPRSMYEQSM